MWQVVVYQQTEPGNKDKPSYLFFIGVKDVKVNDVVIASKIIGHESAKVEDNHLQAQSNVEKLPKPLVAGLVNHIMRPWHE